MRIPPEILPSPFIGPSSRERPDRPGMSDAKVRALNADRAWANEHPVGGDILPHPEYRGLSMFDDDDEPTQPDYFTAGY